MRPRITLESSPTVLLEPEHDRSLEERAFLKEAAYTLLTNLFAACKTIRLYDMNNRAAQRALDDLLTTTKRICATEGRVHLRVTPDFAYLNEDRIALDSHHVAPFEYLRDEFARCEVASVAFTTEVTVRDFGPFLKSMLAIDGTGSAFDELQNHIDSLRVEHIEITRESDEEQTLEDANHGNDIREQSNRVYFKTVALVGDILRTNEERQFLQVRKAKRLTQQMVDIIQTDESLLVGLASIKTFDAYTFAHSVNVCILSMLMGDRLQLDKSDVARLGVAALFHDIGKTYIPSSILNSPGKLNPTEWELMKYHTFFGVKELSRMRGLRDAAEPMFVALQHHAHFNNDGYPQRPGGWQLRLFSRIVTVADYYDAMTASRTYQKDPVTPDKALRFILEKSGDIFDPFIAKLFIQAMGLYPTGTVVELDTGEMGVVVKQNPDPRYIHRPIIDLVDESRPEAPWESADLTERLSGEYRFRRTIKRAIHDSQISVDKAPVFLARESSD